MADVARGAGVSRQTLYNEFGSKDALADALARRQTAAFLAGADAILSDREITDPVEALRAATLWSLDRAHDDPMLKAILTSTHDGGEGNPLLPFLTTRAEPVLEAVSAQLIGFLTRHWPGTPSEHIRDVAESMTRLTVSHVVLQTEPTEVTARVIANFFQLLLNPPHPTGGQ
jgi:AcrR family transcriptional regulator